MAIILTGSTGVATPAVVDASGGNTATINSMTPTADSLQGFRNRIINGDMRIDQRNAGASVNGNVVYSLDRWLANASQTNKYTVQRNAGSVTPPVGFTNYLGVTSSSAYSVGASEQFSIVQTIEGFNTADLGWGAAGAKTVTLSFWVRSSLTGTFGGSFINASANRFYVFSYTISAANTWEYKTITVAGDTSGTWATNNTVGIYVWFSIGAGSTVSGTAGSWGSSTLYQPTGATSVVGTNGATWYITGAQLEVGSVATPFERRDYGRELAMCQRYYYKSSATSGNSPFGSAFMNSTTEARGLVQFPIVMRSSPTALEQTGTATDYRVRYSASNSATCNAVPTFVTATTILSFVVFPVASGLTAGQAGFLESNSSSSYLAWSAEL